MIKGNWKIHKKNIWRFHQFDPVAIDHCTVVGSVTWSLNGSGAADDLSLIKTLPFFMYK